MVQKKLSEVRLGSTTILILFHYYHHQKSAIALSAARQQEADVESRRPRKSLGNQSYSFLILVKWVFSITEVRRRVRETCFF